MNSGRKIKKETKEVEKRLMEALGPESYCVFLSALADAGAYFCAGGVEGGKCEGKYARSLTITFNDYFTTRFDLENGSYTH